MRNLVYRLLTAAGLAVSLLGVSAPEASAGECNLFTTDASGNVIGNNFTSTCVFAGGATFGVMQSTDPVKPTGTGYIDSFLRVQSNGQPKGYEEGYNTGARPASCTDGNGTADCDIKTDGNFTRNLLLSAVPIVQMNGVDYRQFFLDINEPNATDKTFITLDQVEIYLSSQANLANRTDQTAAKGSMTGATKVWDMDTVAMTSPATPFIAPSENWINLSYGLLSGGSGTGDMVMYIPNSYFLTAGYTANTYVYLYSQFGCYATGNNVPQCGTQFTSSGTPNGKKFAAPTAAGTLYAAQAGFEEWWVYSKTAPGGNPLTPVPEPASLTLLGTGLVLAARKRLNRKAASDRA